MDKTTSHKPTVIRIPWNQSGTGRNWNDITAWALENFGLPGDRFTTHPTEDFMDFIFYDPKDATLFALRCL